MILTHKAVIVKNTLKYIILFKSNYIYLRPLLNMRL